MCRIYWSQDWFWKYDHKMIETIHFLQLRRLKKRVLVVVSFLSSFRAPPPYCTRIKPNKDTTAEQWSLKYHRSITRQTSSGNIKLIEWFSESRNENGEWSKCNWNWKYRLCRPRCCRVVGMLKNAGWKTPIHCHWTGNAIPHNGNSNLVESFLCRTTRGRGERKEQRRVVPDGAMV